MIRTLPTLSIASPYCEAIASGLKSDETRSRRVNYKGTVALLCTKSTWSVERSGLTPEQYAEAFPVEPMNGYVIAIADLISCDLMTPEVIAETDPMQIARGFWSVGRYAYRLQNVRRVKPFKASGKPSTLFNLTADFEEVTA